MEFAIENGRVVEKIAPPIVEFYEHARKVGKGKFKPTVYIKTRAAGVKDFMSRLATDDDKEQYPSAWEKFQVGADQVLSGTPLKQLPSYKTAFALELQAMGVGSVESLAAREKPHEAYLVPMWKQAKLYIQLVESDV